MKKIIVCLASMFGVLLLCNSEVKAQCASSAVIVSPAEAIIAEPATTVIAPAPFVIQQAVIATPFVVPTFTYTTPFFAQRAFFGNSIAFAHGGFVNTFAGRGFNNFVNVRVGNNGFVRGGRGVAVGRESIRITNRSRVSRR